MTDVNLLEGVSVNFMTDVTLIEFAEKVKLDLCEPVSTLRAFCVTV